MKKNSSVRSNMQMALLFPPVWSEPAAAADTGQHVADARLFLLPRVKARGCEFYVRRCCCSRSQKTLPLVEVSVITLNPQTKLC